MCSANPKKNTSNYFIFCKSSPFARVDAQGVIALYPISLAFSPDISFDEINPGARFTFYDQYVTQKIPRVLVTFFPFHNKPIAILVGGAHGVPCHGNSAVALPECGTEYVKRLHSGILTLETLRQNSRVRVIHLVL
jgi:hypothetical protein